MLAFALLGFREQGAGSREQKAGSREEIKGKREKACIPDSYEKPYTID